MVKNVNLGDVTLSKEYPDTVLAIVATITTADQSVIAAGVKAGRGYLVAFDALDAGLSHNCFCIADADDSLLIRFTNPTAAGIDPANTGITMHVVGL